MRSLLRRVPIPMAGLALGMAALGNLLKIHSPEIRSVCGLVAAVLWCAVVARILRYPEVSAAICRIRSSRALLPRSL